MKTTINYFSRMLCALLLCAGLVATSCAEGPLENDEKTEQGENENTGNEDEEESENGENTGGNENEGGEENENEGNQETPEDKGPATMTLDKVTATTATFTGHLNIAASDLSFSQVTVYYSDAETFNMNAAESVSATSFDNEQNFTITLTGLKYGAKYNYCMVAEVKSEKTYGEVLDFTTNSLSVDVSVKETPIVSMDPVAEFEGSVNGLSPEDKDGIKIGVAYYSVSEELKSDKSRKVYVSEYASGDSFAIVSETLLTDTKYYYCCFLNQGESYTYFDVKEFQTWHPYSAPTDLNVSSATNLSSSVSSNCYIVSESGLYKFAAVKGNSNESVGNVASASILWETFGTSVAPEYFDLISAFCYKDGYIAFKTADTFREGNTVIAAKDAEGNIIWSWHIWLTDQPEAHVYNNDAGIMMDRNLGATSATPGDVGALGLLYQWGRKDPFLGYSSISDHVEAKSTITWPSAVVSSSATGTVDYAMLNPTTFVIYLYSSDYDWHYASRDNTLWTTSDKAKSIYDPCPSGWRVPDGGDNGVWRKAGFDDTTYDSTNEGISFSISSPSTTWYPASGFIEYNNDGQQFARFGGKYWSASPSNSVVYSLEFDSDGHVALPYYECRGLALSVRCIKE